MPIVYYVESLDHDTEPAFFTNRYKADSAAALRSGAAVEVLQIQPGREGLVHWLNENWTRLRPQAAGA